MSSRVDPRPPCTGCALSEAPASRPSWLLLVWLESAAPSARAVSGRGASAGLRFLRGAVPGPRLSLGCCGGAAGLSEAAACEGGGAPRLGVAVRRWLGRAGPGRAAALRGREMESTAPRNRSSGGSVSAAPARLPGSFPPLKISFIHRTRKGAC